MPIKAVHLEALRKRIESYETLEPQAKPSSQENPLTIQSITAPSQGNFDTITNRRKRIPFKVNSQVATALAVIGVFVFAIGVVAVIPSDNSQAAGPEDNRALIEAVNNLREENQTMSEELQGTRDELRVYRQAETMQADLEELAEDEDQSSPTKASADEPIEQFRLIQ